MSSDKRPSPQHYEQLMEPSALLGRFVPLYADKRVAILDLDQEARDFVALAENQAIHPHALSDADFCSQFVEEVHKRRGIDASFGGYLEDRAFLWQGTYLGGTERALHLGVDFNVPAGSVVTTPFEGVVILIDDDTPERFGWGPRIFLECWESHPGSGRQRYVYIFAHLADLQVSEGTRMYSGQTVGYVGAPPTNGNWYPHLHLQKVRGEVFDRYRTSDLMKLDGYGLRSEADELVKDFPDPVYWLAVSASTTSAISG